MLNTRRDIPYLQATYVIFCSLFRHTDNDVFDDFSKISDHFAKISKKSPKIV